MKREDVIVKLQEQHQPLADQYHIASLYLFGSTARDEAVSGSDVDLLVGFRQPVGLFLFIELKQQLETILGCKVDLGTMRSLKPSIKDQVLQEAIRVA
jgi:hypothetical protein